MVTCFGFGISVEDLNFIFGFLRGKGYIRNLRDNLNNLRTEMENLNAAQQDLETAVKREEAQHRQRLQTVTLWFTRVQNTQRDFDDLVGTSDDHFKELCLCDYCSINVCSSYRYGKKVFLLLEYIRNLNQECIFKEVAGPALKPEVQIQDADAVVNHLEINNQDLMIYARTIEITHSEKPQNWTWRSIYEPQNEVAIEVAELNIVYWLDIRGVYHTRRLTPETRYKVVFVVMLKEIASGWEDPVNLSLKLDMGDEGEILQENTVRLADYIGEGWVDIIAGEFVAPPQDAPAKMFFTMYQYDTSVVKTGLVVKGVAIRAVN